MRSCETSQEINQCTIRAPVARTHCALDCAADGSDKRAWRLSRNGLCVEFLPKVPSARPCARDLSPCGCWSSDGIASKSSGRIAGAQGRQVVDSEGHEELPCDQCFRSAQSEYIDQWETQNLKASSNLRLLVMAYPLHEHFARPVDFICPTLRSVLKWP